MSKNEQIVATHLRSNIIKATNCFKETNLDYEKIQFATMLAGRHYPILKIT